MKMFRKALATVMAVALVAAGMVLPTYAAEATAAEHNAAVAALAKQISDKYYIDVVYPTANKNGEKYAGVDTDLLKNLDIALSYTTPTLVRQVSEFYERTGSGRITFSYEYSKGFEDESMELVIGMFSNRDATIHLYMPRSGKPTDTAYADPLTILHEFGHAYTLMYLDSYGYNKMYSEWTAFNSGHSYHPVNIMQNPDKRVFISGYAATMFEEDLAEIFAYAFYCNRAGLGFTERMTRNGNTTSLGRKVQYMEKTLSRYLNNVDEAVANYRKVYTTPSKISYNGMELGGAYLEYMGYHETRVLLNGVLKVHKITDATGATWIPEIGGWYVERSGGSNLYMFPDASFANSKGKIWENER